MEKNDLTRLIGRDGRPNLGLHSRPFQQINIKDFRPLSMPKLTNFKKKLYKSLKLKRWEYMGVCNEEVIFGIAVVHLGYLSNIFAYVFDRKEKKMKEYNFIRPFGYKTYFRGSPVHGQTGCKGKDLSIKIDNQTGYSSLIASINRELNVDLSFKRASNPLCLATREGLHGFNYTIKEAGLGVGGAIALKGKRYEIKTGSPAGVIDYTVGYPGHMTFWNWASGSGMDKAGKTIGFNFSLGINETGFSENAFWINGRMVKIDLVNFIYDDLHILSPWRIVSSDGRVKLTFHPEGERASNLNLGLIASYFHQLFGSFTGTLSDGKNTYTIKSSAGFTEEHESKW